MDGREIREAMKVCGLIDPLPGTAQHVVKQYLSTIDPEAIRAEALAEALREAAGRIYELAHDFSPGEYYSRMKIITALHSLAAILGAEPAQDDGKPEVGEGDIVAYVFDDGEYTIEQDFSYDATGRWRDMPCRPVIIMRAAELKRLIEEAEI